MGDGCPRLAAHCLSDRLRIAGIILVGFEVARTNHGLICTPAVGGGSRGPFAHRVSWEEHCDRGASIPRFARERRNQRFTADCVAEHGGVEIVQVLPPSGGLDLPPGSWPLGPWYGLPPGAPAPSKSPPPNGNGPPRRHRVRIATCTAAAQNVRSDEANVSHWQQWVEYDNTHTASCGNFCTDGSYCCTSFFAPNQIPAPLAAWFAQQMLTLAEQQLGADQALEQRYCSNSSRASVAPAKSPESIGAKAKPRRPASNVRSKSEPLEGRPRQRLMDQRPFDPYVHP